MDWKFRKGGICSSGFARRTRDGVVGDVLLQCGCHPGGTDGRIGPVVEGEIEVLAMDAWENREFVAVGLDAKCMVEIEGVAFDTGFAGEKACPVKLGPVRL